MLDVAGASAFVEYDCDGMPCRSHVDVADIVDGTCSLERLQDAPHGIQWGFDFSSLAGNVEAELKRAGIWTFEDLQQKDRAIIRIATDLLGREIWQAAKRGCNRR